MPKNLPARKDFLIPFLRMDERTSIKQGFKPNNHKDNSPNLLTNANSEWRKMIEEDKLSTNEQCLEMIAKRPERLQRDLTLIGASIWDVVVTVYQVTSFFQKLIPIITNLLSPPKLRKHNTDFISSLAKR